MEQLRARKGGERCNCESGRCNHEYGCGKPAADTFIDQLGYVCDACAANYPKEYRLN